MRVENHIFSFRLCTKQPTEVAYTSDQIEWAGFSEANGMSSVHETHDGSNARLAAPRSWLTKLCSISLDPKLRWLGARTGGPPLSVHLSRNCFCASSTMAVMS